MLTFRRVPPRVAGAVTLAMAVIKRLSGFLPEMLPGRDGF